MAIYTVGAVIKSMGVGILTSRNKKHEFDLMSVLIDITIKQSASSLFRLIVFPYGIFIPFKCIYIGTEGDAHLPFPYALLHIS